MPTDDYVAFNEKIPENGYRQIARILGLEVMPIARALFAEDDLDDPEILGRFFADVSRVTGQYYKKTDDSYFSNLVEHWRKQKSAQNVVAAYYYLYTIRIGQRVVEKIDGALFSKSFREANGFAVPGGYVDEQSRVLGVNDEILQIVRRVEENQQKGSARASYELLLSIARQYDEQHEASNEAELRDFLTAKVEEWRAYSVRLAGINARDDHDDNLIAEARVATSIGDFATADRLIAESEKRIEVAVEKDLTAKCERIALRAANSSLAGNQVKAASLYDTAAEIARGFSSDMAEIYDHHAANELYLRGFHSADVALADVSERYRTLMLRRMEEGRSKSLQHVAPLLSYCSVTTEMIRRGLKPKDVHQLEEQCRKTISSYADHADITVLARLQNALATLLREYRSGGSDEQRMFEAVKRHAAALELSARSEQPELWTEFQMGLALSLSRIASLSPQSIDRWERAIEAFQFLLDRNTRESDPQLWSRANHNIGSCLLSIAESSRDRGKVHKAFKHLYDALQERSVDQHPFLFARTIARIGDCYFFLAEAAGMENYAEQAVACYKNALKVWKADNSPTDWAKTSYNLNRAVVIDAAARVARRS